jgi:hypothetical protein
MRDDTVTTSWKRSTDKVKTPGGTSVHRSLAEASGTMNRESHAGPLSLVEAGKLAAWEDEGGTTVLVE